MPITIMNFEEPAIEIHSTRTICHVQKMLVDQKEFRKGFCGVSNAIRMQLFKIKESVLRLMANLKKVSLRKINHKTSLQVRMSSNFNQNKDCKILEDIFIQISVMDLILSADF